ncbi:MAG: 2-C-methyl-D-erythritol 4-phosphate cytidylyltransferase [Flammeovirgaceae bacterium]|nr:2-C-methyl-D-erythritol 4-phosphate cytidylyltransferase [Flammeovirgaceae bacterium]
MVKSKNKEEYALIVAGGKGTRIQGKIPKQFLIVAGKPILLHTLEAFINYSESIKLILVLPEDDFVTWEKIKTEFDFSYPVHIVKGGDSRFQSVKNGLAAIDATGLVAIHDGVRPLVCEETIHTSFTLAEVHKTAIASVQLKESLRLADSDKSTAVDRSKYRLIQTPQTFDIDLIKKAYQQKEEANMTDDASVAEKAGYAILLFEGSYDNLKITTAEDLPIAEALLKQRS